MTDTTDIAALREKYKLALKDLTERLMERNRLNYCMDEITAFSAFSSTVIDLLEAERQRAAGSEEELHKALHREKAAERKLLAAQGEIAALKGDQVPVAYVCTSFLDAKESFTISKMLSVGTPLYDRQKKPVVLPETYEPRMGGNYEIELVGVPNGEVYLVSDVKAAIEAAGGLVKDGE